MSEWLFEIFSEEIPSRMQPGAQRQLKALATTALKKVKLEYEDLSTFVTPRRLTLRVEGLAPSQPDQIEEKRGPRVDAPPQAIDGFLSSTGLKREDCEVRDTPKGQFLFAVQEIKGRSTEDLLPALATEILEAFHWPKSMRWGAQKESWVRPIRSLLSLYNSQVVPVTHAGVTSSDITWGHRFMAPDPLQVHNFSDYRKTLLSAHVVLDWQDRRDQIKDAVEQLAATVNCTPSPDEGLLDEVAGLVEYPVPLLCKVDDEFMDLPEDVITTPMRVHQRYFPLRDKASGNLAAHFVLMANTQTQNKGEITARGNERVLRARLADARFFWEHDLEKPLEDFNADLQNLMFHQKLGTMGQKVERIEKLAAWLADATQAPAQPVTQAAQLCKADLVTQMVGEFPELQGRMGRRYALNQGLSEEAAAAIEEHYWPLGKGGKTPHSMTSILVGLADRIDTLVGFFALGIKPTGSKDPYALRRAALGVLSLVSAASTPIALKEAFSYAFTLHNWAHIDHESVLSNEDTVKEVWAFLVERFKYYLKDEQQSTHDHVEAVLAIAEKSPDFKTLSHRVAALDQFLSTDNGTNLLAAYKRASNILRIEERHDNQNYKGQVKEELLSSPAELSLFKALTSRDDTLKNAVSTENFDEVMSILSELRPTVDTFFDRVIVNDTDKALRQNRLELLSKIRNTLHQVADFSKIEG